MSTLMGSTSGWTIKEDIQKLNSNKVKNQDESHILGIMPLEVWLIVIKQIKNGKDLRNLGNASQFFWTLLQKKRVFFLFAGVLEKLAERFEIRKLHVLRCHSDISSYPRIPPKLKIKSDKILKQIGKGDHKDNSSNAETSSSSDDTSSSSEDSSCYSEYDQSYKNQDTFGKRQQKHKFMLLARKCQYVCETWKDAVHNCYQRPLMTGIKDYFDDIRPLHRIIPWTVYEIDCRNENVEQIKRRFELDVLQSFRLNTLEYISIGRSLGVLMDDNTDDQYCLALSRILEKIGELIFYVFFKFDGRVGAKMSTLTRLIEFLKLMPNLKVLEITGGSYGETFSDEFISQNPLPRLERLEMIRFKHVNRPLENLLLQNYNQISRLTVERLNDFEPEIIRSLTKLTTFCSKGPTFDCSILNDTCWQLHKLQLTCDQLLEVPLYFQKLSEKWANTLVDVKFRYECESSLWKDSKNLSLNLNRVRRFSIYTTSIFFLDFILPLKDSVECLVIECTHENFDNLKMVRESQNIELIGFEDSMESSNIWKIFNKLKMITFKFNPGLRKKRFWFYTKTPLCIKREELEYR